MKKLILFLLCPVLAFAAPTQPITNGVVPSGGTLRIQSGGTIVADAGSTVTGFGSGGTPGGSNTQVQYNASGAFAGNAALTFNSGTGALTATSFVGAFTGTATNATNFGVTNDATTNATMYPVWVTANTGNLPGKVASTKLTFNPSTGILTSTGFAGSLAGGTALPISGISATGTPSSSTFLRGDGTWNTPAGGGNVSNTGTPTSGQAAEWTSATVVQGVGVTGTGNYVKDTSATLVTPTLGVASATSINKVAITAPATSATLTIANGKTLTVNNSLTFAGTDGITMTTPTTSFTAARTDAANTFTGVQTMTSPATTTSITTASTSFTAWAGATTLLTLGGTGASASTFFPSTLDTTSSTTGAIRTSGGISAAKALNIGTTGTFGGAITDTAATPQIVLGANATTKGGIKMFGNTSGDVTISPLAVAGTATALTFPATSGGLIASATAIGTVTGTPSSSNFLRGDGTWATPSGTISGLTISAIVTAASSTTIQTADATATMDSSGNISTPGTLTVGNAATTAGAVVLTQGTTQSTGTTNITIQAPTSVTSYIRTLPGTVGSTGYVKETVAGSVQTESVVTSIPATDISSGALSIGNNAATVGTVELGNTTDTTLSRSAAGVLAVEGVVVDTVSATNTLTNKRITARVTSISSSATPTVNTDNCDCVTITALAVAITSMTTNLTGTPVNFDQLEYRIKDDGTARAITWGASFVAGPTALPTTTVISKALHVWFEYDSVQAKWVCVSSGSDA